MPCLLYPKSLKTNSNLKSKLPNKEHFFNYFQDKYKNKKGKIKSAVTHDSSSEMYQRTRSSTKVILVMLENGLYFSCWKLNQYWKIFFHVENITKLQHIKPLFSLPRSKKHFGFLAFLAHLITINFTPKNICQVFPLF